MHYPMQTPLLPLSLALALTVASTFAATVPDRDGAVRKDKATMENDARWIYNDYEKGFAEANRTGKPLLVVLRCVPCLNCMGLDTSVLTDQDLVPLLDQFVCVRVMNANALDLALFQFDYDLSFSTLFFNSDGTVYGRFGSWTHQANEKDKDTASYKQALEAALAIHKGYPANKTSLAGKQGVPTQYKRPIDMPSLAGKFPLGLEWSAPNVVTSCVHCHQLGNGYLTSYREKLEPVPSNLIYPFPAPQTIGLSLAADQIAKVEAVAEKSPAAAAGLQVGDSIVSLAGQPLVSIADASWVLNRAPDAGAIAAVIERNGTRRSLTITLPADWRRNTDVTKRASIWPMRGMALGGLTLEDLPDAERAKRGIANGEMALLVKAAGQAGLHAAARNAGFQKDDIIVKIADKTARFTEGDLIGELLQHHPKGERVRTTVLRGTQRLDLMLPMQ